MPFDPIRQYKTQSINTMSKGEQLVMLFNEALKNLHYGSMMFKEKNYETAEKCTDKCKQIFTYLSSILDWNYSISKELYDLYYFFNQQIIKAEVKRESSYLDELVPLVENMRDTWSEAEKLCHMKK
ncbi:flagellar export chaperone FliS [Caproiciproducens galactitolivorans]|uniref:Flagellar protein FliS n=1 Tax=Caproiciproducens galactitolivorans TaxID=642589 RepID=A0A4Z0Y028_9FIRM|nr:flagellar export chaperone FliS [Caproiciproducens galactitolivorans]QEY33688.1 flagellar export chaperone FliS [Caproiciproducens galactitolivorans]TGJ76187.1 flagellar protein FliS [Caproiciproducens galactitolivorans]